MIKGPSKAQPQFAGGAEPPAEPSARPAQEAPPRAPEPPPFRALPTGGGARKREEGDLKTLHLRAKVVGTARENIPPGLRALPQDDARRARFEQALYSVAWRTEGSKKSEAIVFDRYDLRASPKIKAQGNDFWKAFAHEMDKPYIMASQVTIPEHAMLAIGNGKSGEFRFFDPNAGIFLFQSSAEMADFISRYCGPEGTVRPLDTEELRAALEVALPQGFGPPGSQLGEGICKALTLSVAKWFLENPDFSGPVDTSTLGLKEFEPLESGLRSLDERAFKTAASSFLVALDLMSAEQKMQMDKDGQIFRAELLARSSTKENWNSALYELKNMNTELPYVAAVMGLAFAKIEGKTDFKLGLPLNWKGYNHERVFLQQLLLQ